jgi:Sulfotransferase domain
MPARKGQLTHDGRRVARGEGGFSDMFREAGWRIKSAKLTNAMRRNSFLFARRRAANILAAALGHEGEKSSGLEHDAQRLATHYYGYKQAYETVNAEIGELRADKAACEHLRSELEAQRLGIQELTATLQNVKAEHDAKNSAHTELAKAHKNITRNYNRLQQERDGYKSSYETLNAEVGTLQTQCDGYKLSYDALAAEVGKLRIDAEPLPRSADEAERMAGKPSLFIVCQPKAGTKYLGATLAGSLGYDYGRNVVTHTFPKNLIWQGMAHDFLRGGMVSVSHLEPDSFNVQTMKEIGLTKGVIQFRDPRAALYSQFHYFVDHQLYRIYNPVSGQVFLDLTEAEQIAYHIERFFKPLVAWISGWIDVLETEQELDFLVTTHEELVADERDLFSKILRFYGIDANLKPAVKDRNTHFRSGNNTEWRAALSPSLVASLNAIIPERLWRRFGWQP